MDTKLLNHLCALSKLNIDDWHKEETINKMSAIIQLMDTINDMDVEEIEDKDGISVQDLRQDVSNPSIPRNEILQNANETMDNCFVVPNIME